MLGGEAAGCLGGGMGFAGAIELLFAIGISLIGLLYGTPPHSPHASHIFAAYGILTCVSVGQEGSNDVMNL
jgi:hypothetical protein